MRAMIKKLLINGKLINEDEIREADVLIEGQRISRIEPSLSAGLADEVIDLQGRYLLPGLIDDQVHFREPGLTHKGSLATESKAAISGGVTSVLEMPNTSPPTTDRASLLEKWERAKGRSFVNYAFYLGATNDNLDEIRRVVPGEACGIKVFMGASTGNMLVDDPRVLEKIFADSPLLIATHCEDSPTIWANEAIFRERFGEDVPMSAHPQIRSEEACYKSSSMAVELAKRHGARLHVLHLSTLRELSLFEPGPIEGKDITSEVCVHHLWFDQSRYADLGSRIKCNPAIKTSADREGLLQGVLTDHIDVIATDHAPHTVEEKMQPYFMAPAGLPLVQHSLQTMLEFHCANQLSLEKIVRKSSHNPAVLFGIVDRGFIREGYFADLVSIDLDKPQTITSENILYRCGWSPFEGKTFSSSIHMTMLNGDIVFRSGEVVEKPNGQPIAFLQR
jgi:dihydroorotase